MIRWIHLHNSRKPACEITWKLSCDLLNKCCCVSFCLLPPPVWLMIKIQFLILSALSCIIKITCSSMVTLVIICFDIKTPDFIWITLCAMVFFLIKNTLALQDTKIVPHANYQKIFFAVKKKKSVEGDERKQSSLMVLSPLFTRSLIWLEVPFQTNATCKLCFEH